MVTLFVGNLDYRIDDATLSSLFTPFGDVFSARVIIDRETARPRGFGFVSMDSNAASRAQAALHESEQFGRRLIVNPARPKYER